MANARNVDHYRRLPYERVVELREEDGGAYFLAYIKEIPFIRIDGATKEEALYHLDRVFEDCILSMIETGDEIAEPEMWPGANVDRSQQMKLIESPPAIHAPAPNVSTVPSAAAPSPWTVAPEAETAGAW